MSATHTCPLGHRWQGPAESVAPGGAGPRCPECGSLSEAPPAPRPAQAAVEKLEALLAGPDTTKRLTPAPDKDPTQTGTPDAPAPVVSPAGYELLEELGRGGMGVVYKAKQLCLNRLVALKMILGGGPPGAEELKRFRAEADAVARLQHPSIVSVYEVGEAGGRPYLALEYVDGGSLARRLAGSPLPAREAAELLRRLALAVHAAHQAGIVHRDLKPSNILLQKSEVRDQRSEVRSQRSAGGGRASASSDLCPLTSDLWPKITDFGLAKRLDAEQAQTLTGAVLGTPSYMAPEQALGRTRDIGPAADIHALGAILYEMLTGRPPFKGVTTLDTLEQVRTQEPVPPSRLQPKLPRDLENVCLKCLQEEPGQRYASAFELAEDLRRFLDGEPVRARRVSAVVRLARWSRRRPALAGLVAVSVLALLSLTAVGWWYNVRLQAAVKQAEENAADAQAQRAQAEARFLQARAALARLLQSVQHRLLADLLTQVKNELSATDVRGKPLPEILAPGEREQLRALLEFYQPFLHDGADPDPVVRRDTALDYERVGLIRGLVEQGDPAMEDLHKSQALLEGLVKEDPENPVYAYDLARVCFLRAAFADRLGRTEEARAACTRAIDALEPLVRKHPRWGEGDGVLRGCYAVRALLNKKTGRWVASLADLGHLVALQRASAKAQASAPSKPGPPARRP